MTEHLNDGQLIQVLDGSSQRDALESEHLDRCAECRSRLVTLRARTKRFSALLRQTDETVPELQLPPSRHFDRRVASVAATLLLIAAAFIAQPVRAWIFAQGRAVWERLYDSGPHESPSAGAASKSRDTLNTVDVGFTPQQSTLYIEVMNRQFSGAIVMRRVTGPEVTATVVDATEADGIVILPHGFRIENSTQSVATYSVKIPSTIENVEIVVGGDVVSNLEVGPSFDERIVDLSTVPRS